MPRKKTLPLHEQLRCYLNTNVVVKGNPRTFLAIHPDIWVLLLKEFSTMLDTGDVVDDYGFVSFIGVELFAGIKASGNIDEDSWQP